MEEPLNIIFMSGGAEYTVDPLKSLVESKHRVNCVFTKPIKLIEKKKEKTIDL